MRAFGRILPDLIGLGIVAKEVGAAHKIESIRRIDQTAAAVEGAGGRLAVLEPIDAEAAEQRLAKLHLDPASAVGRAARQRMEPPFGGDDQWLPVRLRPGDQIFVTGDLVASPVGELLPTSGEEWSKSLQIPPWRETLTDGTISAPQYASEVQVLTVGPEGFDTAGATALANPQFGAGGGYMISPADIHSGMADGRLIDRGEIHSFDPSTLKSPFEDPSYRAANPKLPELALDPEHEEIMGRIEGGSEKLGETARGMVKSTALAGAAHQTDRGGQ